MRNFKKSIIASALTASLALVGVANAEVLNVSAAVNASCGALSLYATTLNIGTLTPGTDTPSAVDKVTGTCVNGSSANVVLSDYTPDLTSTTNANATIPFKISSTAVDTGAWTTAQAFNSNGTEQELAFYAIAEPSLTAEVGAYTGSVTFTFSI